MVTARVGHAATRLSDGRVLITGGRLHGFLPYTFLQSAELYDPATGTFSEAGETLLRPGAATLLNNGSVLITGDHAAALYNPQTGSSSNAGRLDDYYCTQAALLTDGRALVLCHGYAWLYSPDTGSFGNPVDQSSELLYWLSYETLTALPNGAALFTGGRGVEEHSVATSVLLGPSMATLIPSGTMTFPRQAHTASLLLNGLVLIAGGNLFPAMAGAGSETGGALDSLELYKP